MAKKKPEVKEPNYSELKKKFLEIAESAELDDYWWDWMLEQIKIYIKPVKEESK
jgi:hypothetical protein